MAKSFEGKYVKVKELGAHKNMTVEIGHYTDSDTVYADKIYVFDHFVRRDGTEDSRIVAKFTLEDAKAIASLILSEE